ncbi:serine/threonine-protein phosphatase [Streptomyces thinghirensis]|nr:serine/threonine-protein phosphatase [Streptomyces thinghirensis]
MDAAALMGQVRTAVHAHATVGGDPDDDVLARTNRLLTDLDPGLFTSCVYVHLDLRHAPGLSVLRRSPAAAGAPCRRTHRDSSRCRPTARHRRPDAQYSVLECDLPPST